MFRNLVNSRAFWTLIATRSVYAVNWYNVASIFSFVAQDLGEGVSGLGLLSSSFFLGIGIFQVPGSIVATRLGPKRTAVVGTFVASAAALVSGVVPDFTAMVGLRFVVGAGMAFVFPSSLVLSARYYKEGAEGLSIGLHNSAFSLGGALGVIGWVILANLEGWRLSLVASGALGIVTGVMLLAFIPGDRQDAGFRIDLSEVRKILLGRSSIMIGFYLLGISVGSRLVDSFMVFYLEQSIGLAPGEAAVIGSMVLIVPVVSAPIGGRAYDLVRSTRKLIFLSGLGVVFGVVLSSFSSVVAAVIATVITGFASGVGFTFGFSVSRELYRRRAEYAAIAVSWTNCISLFGIFWSPITFATVAGRFGYPLAWLVGGIYTLGLILPLAALKERNIPEGGGPKRT